MPSCLCRSLLILRTPNFPVDKCMVFHYAKIISLSFTTILSHVRGHGYKWENKILQNQSVISFFSVQIMSPEANGSLQISSTENYFLKYFVNYSDTIVDISLSIFDSSFKGKLLNFTHLYKFACIV